MAQKYRLKSSTVIAAQWDGRDTAPVADLFEERGAALKPSNDGSLSLRRPGVESVTIPYGYWVVVGPSLREPLILSGSEFGNAYRKAR